MCGISAYIPFLPTSTDCIKAMTDIIRHRGPDDEGFMVLDSKDEKIKIYGGTDTPEHCYQSTLNYCPEKPIGNTISNTVSLAFGHRRLSILDTTVGGHQPMCCPEGRYWIIYNGEVFNYIELKRELEDDGYSFYSTSDTEVILAAYKKWGRDFLNKLNGMFAFLIYDFQRKSILAVRDRFGIKPIYYWVSNHGVAFASEIKQFTVLPGWEAVLNGQRAYDYLNWGVSDHTVETFFKGVYQLRGGEALELSINELLHNNKPSAGKMLSAYRWYNLKPRKFNNNDQLAVKKFNDLFYDSVKLRLRADVPVGSCLSGGLDSSSIVCVMNALLKENEAPDTQKTFSACSEIERFNEKKYVDIVVKHTRVNANYVYPTIDDIFRKNETIVWFQDEPYNTTSVYAQWNVFKLASENNIVVMLDGQGADEQLAGYHRFFGSRFTTLFRELKWMTLLSEIRKTKRLHGRSVFSALISIVGNLLPGKIRQVLLKRYGLGLIRSDWLNLDNLGAKPMEPKTSLGAKTATITDRSFWELTSSNLQMLLHWEDRNSMAHSVEARLPFLDYRLVETVLGMPDNLKISNGVTKVVLREAMINTLPEEIRGRMDKLGFVTPEQEWVCNTIPDQFKGKIKETVERYSNVFNKNTIEITNEIIEGKRKYSSLPWRVISFGMWMEKFNVQIR